LKFLDVKLSGQGPRLFGIEIAIGIGIDGFLVFDPDFDFEQFRPT
jgi:hypothetical protein